MTSRNSSPSYLSPRFPAWQREYEAALMETDTVALFRCVEAAEPAILTRREALESSADHYLERKAIEEALAHLRFLKKERLKFY